MVEVLLAFALVHVSFRAIKHFTIVGAWEHAAHTNFTPGAVMILFTMLVIILGRRDPSQYGLTLRDWQAHLGIGLVACAVLVALSLAGVGLGRIKLDFSHPPDLIRGVGGAVVGIIGTGVIALLLRKNWIRGIPWVASFAILTLLLCVPLVLKSDSYLTILWLFFGAGFGEEIFYRGYIQSRVNEAFENPWPGILISSLLFGFLHALNTVDYFRGRWDFAWWYALQSFFIGLFYGVLRARTGSVLPGAIAHGLSDVLAAVPRLLRG